MSDQTEENNDDLSMKDVFVLSVVATTTIMGVGAIARLGYDLAEEGINKLKERRNKKNQK